MDLKGGQIRVGEILKNPEAKKILISKVPGLNSETLNYFCSMSMNKAVSALRMYGVSLSEIQKVIDQIKAL